MRYPVFVIILLLPVAFAFALSGCASYDLGAASGMVTGSAGDAGAVNAATEIPKCQSRLGTVAIIEDDDFRVYFRIYSSKYNLPRSVVPLISLMVQQSGCFTIVDRNRALVASQREMELANQGYLRKGNRISKGQFQEADFMIVPTLAFDEGNAGGIGAAAGAALGAVFGGYGGFLGPLIGGVRFREAQTTLTLVNTRSSVQVAAAEGSASKADMGGVVGFLGSSGGGAVGGWQNSNEAKIVAAAFLDSVQKMLDQAKAAPR